MEIVRLHDLHFTPFLSAESIAQRVKELAAQLSRELEHEQPLFIGILNGVFVFASDLLKQMHIDCEITFVKLSSYDGTTSSGKVRTSIGLNDEITGRNVIVLEDIIDTGKTVSQFTQELKKLNPESIRVVTLLFKPDALEYDLEIDYIGFKVPNKFLVGYGLDYDGLGRNLKDIYVKC
jgi:hypoxanthine phosphoribosyltransferase